jgi:hypothetical protein
LVYNILISHWPIKHVLDVLIHEFVFWKQKKPGTFIFYAIRGTHSCMMNVYIMYLDRGHNGCDRIIVGFTTTCAISGLWVWTPPRWGVLDTTLCDNVVSDWLQVGGFPGTPVSSTNKTDWQYITEILLKFLKTKNQALSYFMA